MSKSFRDLVAFQRAFELMIDVYVFTRSFPGDERFGLTAQMRRASVGVAAQIAEGQGRLTYGEWRQFLSQARGSLYEVDALSMAAERLGFLQRAEYERLTNWIQKTMSALMGLIRWVQQMESKRKSKK